MKVTSMELGKLTPEQRQHLLQRIGAELTGRKATADRIRPRSDGSDTVPASYLQEQLWFLDQLAPSQTSYNVPSIFRVRGTLDLPALQQAITGLVDRHETLRTTFTAIDSRPFQVVSPVHSAAHRLRVDDLRDLDASEREEEALRRATEEIRRPFDLANGPLFRALLIQIADDDHLFATTTHHIVCDGWSQTVMVNEIGELYAAALADRAPELPDLQIQYADYALWQRDQIRDDVFATQLDQWEKHLADAPTVEFPTDHPRPPTLSYRSDMVSRTLDRDLVDRLRALSNEHGCTLFMTLMAAYHVALLRYSGQEEIVVGTTTTGRSEPELEPLIGHFVNMVVLRTDASGAPTFAELLDRVRSEVLRAWRHQDVPFEKVVQRVAPRRDPSRNPLFQLGLQLLGNATSGSGMHLPGLHTEPVDANVGGHPFDLSVTAYENPDSLRLVAEYSLDLFEEPRVRRLLGHLEQILRAATDDINQPITQIRLLDETEWRQVTELWQGPVKPNNHAPVHVRIAEVAARYPDHVAIRAQVGGEWQDMTYQELIGRAELLARRLRALGVGHEDIVAVALNRGMEVPLAMLAAQRAGGAFVVMDPSHPRRRLEYVLRDTASKVVLTTSDLRDRLPDDEIVSVISLDTEWSQIESADTSQPLPELATEKSLAYVLYTSGSTGKPKGVMVEHHALCTFLDWMGPVFNLGPGDRVLQHMALIFDFAEGELYTALAHGATLVFAPEEARTDPEALGVILTDEKINYFNGPPAILGRVPFDSYPDLKGLIAGGEALAGDLVNRWNVGDRTFINGYGPTEAAVGCIYYKCEHRTWQGQPPIGRAMPNRFAYVLDRWDNPLPVGIPGEIVVGGEGLARGYLNHPELTEARFVPNPIRPGERIYRTGDLGLWTEDGQLRFLGRIDTQVKLHGLRIELEEIEAMLASHPSVKEGAVVLREDTPGNKRLVGYAVPTPGSNLADSNELRSYLLDELPPYMVPAIFVQVDQLPLAPSGKVDRQALPAPEQSVDAQTRIAPRTPAEQRIADIFGGILESQDVDAEANFFELGGNSLQAARVLSQVLEQTGVSLSMREFYLSPRVCDIAEHVNRTGAATQTSPRVAPVDPPTASVQPVTSPAEPVRDAALSEEALLRQRVAELERQLSEARSKLESADPGTTAELQQQLSMSQEQLWFLDQLAPGRATYIIQIPMRLTGPLNVSALERAVNHLLERHEALRSRFESVDGVPHLTIVPHRDVPLPVEDFSSSPEAERETAMLARLREDASTAFDLRDGLMLRACLLRASEIDHILSLNVHHICSDGWSAGVLAADLATAYNAARRNQRPEFSPLSYSYAEFAAEQRRRLEAGEIEPHLNYWVERLADLPVIELPSDRPRPSEHSGRGAQLIYRMPADIRNGLRQVAQSVPASPYAALLAGFTAVISRYSGSEDVVVGTADAGRHLPNVENVVGFFVNMLPLRVDLGGNPTYRELVRRAMDTILDALDHRDAPFEKIVERLNIPRDASRNPLFTVSIDLLSGAPVDLPMQGLATEFVDVDPGVSRFDMAINGYDEPDGITLRIEYSTDLFDEVRIRRMFGHLEQLLRAALVNADQPLSTLSLADEEEAGQLLELGTGPTADHPHRSLPALVDAWTERAPQAVAIIEGQDRISYAELTDRSSRLAAYLRERGVRPGSTVAVEMPRSIDGIVTALAAMRAGGTYAPVDPDYPAHRRQLMVEDMSAAVVIDQRNLPEMVAAAARLDPLMSVPELGGDTASHLLYTSGSTGRPKGVLIAHHQVANFVSWMATTMAIQPGDRMLHCCNPSFDVANAEVYGALTSGAAVVIAPAGDGLVPDALGALVRDHEVSHIFTTPTVLRLLPQGEYPRLRCVMAAGEPCPPELVNAWNVRPRVFYNLYGPAEATIAATWYECPEGEHTQQPPIGRPVANYSTYVLDHCGQLAPIGVPGEIVLGGVGVAEGYLRRPELTAERFAEDPFNPGGRVYRTGDLGFWDSDGWLRYLGRRDTQVKIRGLRIELAEVEFALSSHPSVQGAVVHAADDRQSLTGFVAAKGDAELDDEELRAHVAALLPSYMVPNRFVKLDEIPLSPNGKVDRRALQEMDVASTQSAAGGGGSLNTPTEVAVARILGSLLGVTDIGSEDNFFGIGGTSLQAIQAMPRLTSEFGVEISLRELYAAQTVSALATIIDERRGIGDTTLTEADSASIAAPVVTLRPSANGGRPVWLLPAVSGSPYSYNALSRLLPGDNAVVALAAPGLEDGNEPIGDMVSLATAYLRSIREQQPEGPYLLAGWSMGGFVSYEVAQQLTAAGGKVDLVAMIDSADPGPLPPPSEVEIAKTFVKDLTSSGGQTEPPIDAAELAKRDTDGRIALIREALIASGFLTSDVRVEFLRARFRVFRADVLAMYGYQPHPYDGTVVMVRGEHGGEERTGWQPYVTGRFARLSVPGNHYTMWAEPNLSTLAATLGELIKEAGG